MSIILIATDGSELASKAVAEGIGLAKALGSHITILTVTAPLASLGDQGTAFASLPESVAKRLHTWPGMQIGHCRLPCQRPRLRA